jgi:hypothetical protein
MSPRIRYHYREITVQVPAGRLVHPACLLLCAIGGHSGPGVPRRTCYEQSLRINRFALELLKMSIHTLSVKVLQMAGRDH